MNYMLAIIEPAGQRSQRPLQQGQAVYARMLDFAEALKAEGRLRGVESLLSDDQGRRVQRRDGRTRCIDGPFTESKEMIGGFFLIDCESIDEAVAWAARCPAAEWATVEVRPVGPCWA